MEAYVLMNPIIKFTRKKIIWKKQNNYIGYGKTKILIYEHPHSLDGAWMLITWIMYKKVHIVWTMM